MMQYNVDWCSGLASVLRGGVPEESEIALRLLKEKFSITRHCLMTEYDAVLESVSAHLLRRRRLVETLHAHSLPDHKFHVATRVSLTPDLYEASDLEKLLFSSEELLCLRLPISSYEDWMDLEINRLLYKRKLKLCFTSFELAVVLYPPEVIEKLSRIRGAVFQVNFRALAEERVCEVVQNLIKQNTHVLLGTGIDSPDKIWYYEFDYYMDTARERLSPDSFMTLMRNNRLFWRKL